ncbi:mitochondrial potassium channel ATP-binding subunit-like [Lithobates pipiens]
MKFYNTGSAPVMYCGVRRAVRGGWGESVEVRGVEMRHKTPLYLLIVQLRADWTTASQGIVLGTIFAGGSLMAGNELSAGDLMSFLVASLTVQRSPSCLAHLSWRIFASGGRRLPSWQTPMTSSGTFQMATTPCWVSVG